MTHSTVALLKLERGTDMPRLDPSVQCFLDRLHETTQTPTRRDALLEGAEPQVLAREQVLDFPGLEADDRIILTHDDTQHRLMIFAYVPEGNLSGWRTHGHVALRLARQTHSTLVFIAIRPQLNADVLEARCLTLFEALRARWPTAHLQAALVADGPASVFIIRLSIGRLRYMFCLVALVLWTPELSEVALMPAAQLSLLPTLLFVLAESDPFLPDALAFTHRLYDLEQDVTAVTVMGSIHSFGWLQPLIDSPPTQTALTLTVQALREQFAP
ncbi:MAG: hypothetical protein WBQ60_05555 [Asticcacaulis sp.]